MRTILKVNLIFLTILLCFATSIWGQVPTPFDEIKEHALKRTPVCTKGCCFVSTFEINENGQTMEYVIGYLSATGYIGIGKFDESILKMVEYNERTKEFYSWQENIGRTLLDKDKAIRKATELLQELKKHKLL